MSRRKSRYRGVQSDSSVPPVTGAEQEDVTNTGDEETQEDESQEEEMTEEEQQQESTSQTPVEEVTESTTPAEEIALEESQQEPTPTVEQSEEAPQEDTPSEPEQTSEEPASTEVVESDDDVEVPTDDEQPTVVVVEDSKQLAKVKEILGKIKDAIATDTGGEISYMQDLADLLAGFLFVFRNNATPQILDYVVDFFKENLEGVCAPEKFLQPISLLDRQSQRRLSHIYTLWYSMASGQKTRVDNGASTTIMGKSTFYLYYRRFFREID
jgi:hypothetical protein